MKTYTIETWIGDDDCIAIVCYTPGDPGCRTMRNGDPGWPPTDPLVEVQSVTVDGVEVSDADYSVDAWDSLHDRIAQECEELFREEIEALSTLRSRGECDGRR